MGRRERGRGCRSEIMEVWERQRSRQRETNGTEDKDDEEREGERGGGREG